MGLASIKDVFVTSKEAGRAPALVARIFDVTFDTSYTANGEAITPAQLGLSSIVFVQAESSTDGAHIIFDHAASKLRIFVSGASGSKLGEAAGASNQSTVVARLMVWGKP